MRQPLSFQLTFLVTGLTIITLSSSCQKTENASTLPTVITADLTGTSANTAAGGGEVTDGGGGTVTERGVCWSVSTGPTISNNKTSDGDGTGIFTSAIKGLSPGKSYFVKAYATNSVGTAYGSEISFHTDTLDLWKDTLNDPRDGHQYATQKIGDQTWMAENLAYLPAVAGPETGSDSLPYYYVYGYDSTILASARDSANYKDYGVLYNWPAAMKVCPSGWHLPSVTEWKELIESVGTPAGGKLKETGDLHTQNGQTHWFAPNTGATNESGFDAIPGGIRYSLSSDTTILDKFRYITEYAAFWTSTEKDITNSRSMHLYYNNNRIDQDWFSKSNGFSVRCVKN